MKEKIVERFNEAEKALKNSLLVVAGIYAIIEEEGKKVAELVTSKDELLKKGEKKSEFFETKMKEISEKLKEQLESVTKLQETIQSKIKELSEKVSLKNTVITEEEAKKEAEEMA